MLYGTGAGVRLLRSIAYSRSAQCPPWCSVVVLALAVTLQPGVSADHRIIVPWRTGEKEDGSYCRGRAGQLSCCFPQLLCSKCLKEEMNEHHWRYQTGHLKMWNTEGRLRRANAYLINSLMTLANKHSAGSALAFNPFNDSGMWVLGENCTYLIWWKT